MPKTKEQSRILQNTLFCPPYLVTFVDKRMKKTMSVKDVIIIYHTAKQVHHKKSNIHGDIIA
jgi:hypothetical protein